MQLGSDGDFGGEVNATENKAELATPVDTPVETPVDTPRAQQGAAAFRRKQQFLDKGHFYIAKNNYSGCKRYMGKKTVTSALHRASTAPGCLISSPGVAAEVTTTGTTSPTHSC